MSSKTTCNTIYYCDCCGFDFNNEDFFSVTFNSLHFCDKDCALKFLKDKTENGNYEICNLKFDIEEDLI